MKGSEDIMNIKNAFDYHNELSELSALVSSLEYSIDYIENAFAHIDDNTNTMIPIALSTAQADLRKSLEKIRDRRDHIVNKLSSSYF